MLDIFEFEDDPVALQTDSVLPLSRRLFLGGAISSPLLALQRIADAGESKPMDWELRFELSSVDRTLTVTETSFDKDGHPIHPICWAIPATSFGPDAWFDMERPALSEQSGRSARRRIWVRNVSYGNQHRATVGFDFTRPAAKGKSERWRIAYETDLWSPSSGASDANIRSGDVEFSKFRDGTATLDETVASTRVARALERIFSSRINLAASPPRSCRVSLQRNLLWSVGATRGDVALLSVFEHQVNFAALDFGWRRTCASGSIFFAGRATIDPAPRTDRHGMTSASPFVRIPLVIGDAKGHHVEIEKPVDKVLPLEIRVGASPIRPADSQTVLALRIDEAALVVKNGAKTISGPIPAGRLALSITELPDTNPPAGTARIRTVLWGDAFPAAMRNASGPPVLIASPIGMLKVGPPALDVVTQGSGSKAGSAKNNVAEAAGNGTTCETPASNCDPSGNLDDKAAARLFQAASGDRAGAQDSTVFVVNEGSPTSGVSLLRRVSIDVSLVEAMAAPPDTSFSRLTFAYIDQSAFARGNRVKKGVDLRLHFEDGRTLTRGAAPEYPRALASSFVWVGPSLQDGQVYAELDLSRAALTCARDYDLMKLRLRFHDLLLAFSKGRVPVVRPARAQCRVRILDDGTLEDSRPVIVAEFDPQHVMEEAILRPEPLGLPDVDLIEVLPDVGRDRESILRSLATKTDVAGRRNVREKVREAKRSKTGKEVDASAREIFGRFADAYEKYSRSAGLPDDQTIYIGPFALDPDAMALARKVQQDSSNEDVGGVIDAMLVRVDGPIFDSLLGDPKSGKPKFLADIEVTSSITLPPPSPGSVVLPGPERANALRNEALFEQQEPLYGVFRDHWRNELVKARSLARSDQPPSTEPLDLNPIVTAEPSPWLDEYLAPRNRPPALLGNAELLKKYLAIEQLVKHTFVFLVSGKDRPPIWGLLGARLSGPSRLAFRINCEPVAGLDAEEAGLSDGSGHSPAHPGSGSASYRPIAFTFDALTDWSRHEPAVTRRSQRLFNALPSGTLPPLGNRAANEADLEILRFQGFPSGPATGAKRMSDVRKSLAQLPTSLETAIEIPARLVLSTAQDAVWQTPRHLPKELVCASGDEPISLGQPSEIILEDGTVVILPGNKLSARSWHLWSVRLDVNDVTPDVRVVASPDLRPMALDGRKPQDDVRLPGHGAPPRGPWAPWFIGLEQMESGSLSAEELAPVMQKQDSKRAAKDGTTPVNSSPLPTCEAPPAEPKWQFFRWLCERAAFRKRLPAENYAFFRTSLDAYDRHQLVLLTSAYGLPVTGRRLAAGGNVEMSGGLVSESGQIEPGNDYTLLDGRSDQAIYRPVSLAVRELSLTALGGSFLHDTAFKPAAGADDALGRKIFEGFSIERWQHEIVLGRDIRAEVVYKGYLLPLGHRASFVKLTERLFLRTPKGGIKALLRQRFFIRVATPRKAYPAIGQPHDGRMWCGNAVTLLTVRTPDLIDPGFPIGRDASPTNPEGLNGRIYLGGNAGIAFWPRTDITPNGLLRFEVDIDGAKAKLPMLFLDNIAATNKDSLTAAANHFNGSIAPPDTAPIDKEINARFEDLVEQLSARRKVLLNGQTVSFADASKPGDTSFKVEEIELRVHGRDSGDLSSWAGNLGLYQTTGALEGAEQPSFYPALYWAKIRLGQAERFSGAGSMMATVQYDGHYVRYGFAKAPEPSDSPKVDPSKENTAEVFLNFDAVVPLNMGGNGDRSAGIGRPNAWLIALSRKSGPLGGGDDKPVRWRINPNGGDPPIDLLDKTSGKPEPKLQVVAGNREKLVSLANYFSWSGQDAASIARSKDAAPAVQRGSGASPSTPEALQRLRVLQSYVSGDAKVLGSITIRDLLALLDFKGMELPALREVTEYGTAVSKAANNVAGDLRTRVLGPLREVVGRLKSEWERLDEALQKRQRDISTSDGILSLQSIYPEVDANLSAVREALDAAIAAENVEEVPGKLATLYESAQLLIRNLAALASHPVERLQEAVMGSLLQRLNSIKSQLSALGNLPALIDIAQRLRKFSPKELADWVLRQLKPPTTVGESVTNFLTVPVTWVHPASKPRASWADEVFTLGLAPPDLVSCARSWFETSVEPLPKQLEDKLEEIGRLLRDELTSGGESILQNLLESLFQRLLNDKALPEIGDSWARGLLHDAVQQFKSNVSSAISGASNSAKTAADDAKVLELGFRLKHDLSAYADYVATRLPTAASDELLRQPDLALAVATVGRISVSITRLRDFLDAAGTGDPKKILASAAPVVQDILGVDLESLNTAVSRSLGAYLDRQLKAASSAFGALNLSKENLLIFRREIDACRRYRDDQKDDALPLGTNVGSTLLLKSLATAIAELAMADIELRAVGEVIANDRPLLKGWLKQDNLVQEIENFHKRLRALATSRDPKDKSLLSSLKHLYCAVVDAMVSLRAIAARLSAPAPQSADPWTRFDRVALDRISVQLRTFRTASEQIAAILVDELGTLASFVSDPTNTQFVAAGVLSASASFLGRQDAPEKLKQLVAGKKGQLISYERSAAKVIGQAVNAIESLAGGADVAATDGVDAVIKGAHEAFEAIANIGISVKPEGGLFIEKLVILRNQVALATQLQPIADQDSLASLLRQPVDASGRTVQSFFRMAGGTVGYVDVASGLRNAEGAATAAWFAVIQRLDGLPVRLRTGVEKLMQAEVLGTPGVFAVLSDMYRKLLSARNEAYALMMRSALTQNLAKALVADATPPYPDIQCAADVNQQIGCDLLLQEAGVLQILATISKDTNQSDVLPPATRAKIVRFLGSWGNGNSAPLKILKQAEDVVVHLIRGDVLAVIDLGLFRDQIQDAIASLIPTRVKLSYDFSSTVTSPSSDQAIFQPSVGAQFQIQVRGSVDLLNPRRNSFRALGSLGPFRIKLVGGLVDALELRFRGAEFEMAEGAKPRFAVVYDDFVIGPALDFVKKLESFLTPKDGNSVFVQPLTRAAGIESGFGINLQTIGVGATSFFNVILNVSAELPFDDSESLFKVSLGRRLSPFSVSVLPFCGSGYFAIFCAADGIRGFEASFEFGAGGSLGFGPLKAQCRIQVGVYVRVLNVSGRNTTTILGTFFAGGSASLWIFSFSTSLYVRLGQQDGGAMYGEAVYSFSFSLGIAKFNYSVTAFHTQESLGSGSNGKSSEKKVSLDLGEPIHLAALDTGTRSDAGPGYKFRRTKRSARSSRNRGSKTDALSVSASGQREWLQYRNYFNNKLVEHLLETRP